MFIQTLTPLQLHAHLLSNSNAIVIDVRTPVEFSEVHAHAAINLPLDKLSPDSLTAMGCIEREEPVYLFCRSGQRATKAAAKLLRAGFTQPIVISGGTLAWIDAGLPVMHGATRVISLERQVRIAAGGLVLAGIIFSQSVHPNFVWLSGFVGAGLVFAGITDFCGMGLLIAKLPWNRRVA